MKQRLVGAVVLVSLAVIFIPMLLDGDEQGGMPMFGSNIPERPDYQFEPLDIPLEPVEPVPEEMPQLVEKPEPPPASPAGEQSVTEKPPTAEVKAPAKAPAASPEAEQEPVGWVVQVGSFSQSDNALRLRDKLRGKGFTAFVEKLKTAEGTVYRVRIGPELKREAAEAQLEKLQRELKMKGIVMGHSS
jgi:DedD protein